MKIACQKPSPLPLLRASIRGPCPPSALLRAQSFGAREGHRPLYPCIARAASTCHGTHQGKLTDIRAQIRRCQNAQAAGDRRIQRIKPGRRPHLFDWEAGADLGRGERGRQTARAQAMWVTTCGGPKFICHVELSAFVIGAHGHGSRCRGTRSSS